MLKELGELGQSPFEEDPEEVAEEKMSPLDERLELIDQESKGEITRKEFLKRMVSKKVSEMQNQINTGMDKSVLKDSLSQINNMVVELMNLPEDN